LKRRFNTHSPSNYLEKMLGYVNRPPNHFK